MSLSVCIITLNEGKVIDRAIKSVIDIADEIVIVDSGSTDNTLDIVRSFKKTKIYINEFKGYASQKNYAISVASCDWIFFLDADEYLDSELNRSLSNLDSKEDKIYGVLRNNWLWGDFLGTSMGRDIQYRLFRNNCNIKYINEVHEELVGRCRSNILLNGNLLHKPCNDSANFIFTKQLKYTDLEISKVKFRKSLFLLSIKPFVRFFYILFCKRGIFAGWRGVALSFIAMVYDAVMVVKIVELYLRKDKDEF